MDAGPGVVPSMGYARMSAALVARRSDLHYTALKYLFANYPRTLLTYIRLQKASTNPYCRRPRWSSGKPRNYVLMYIRYSQFLIYTSTWYICATFYISTVL